MAKIFECYHNNAQYCWYDSSNAIFSKCYDNAGQTKVLKIVFKNGATYLYRDVDVNDYIAFRDAPSNGVAFSKYIKKYTPTRIGDTDLGSLEDDKLNFMKKAGEIMDSKVSELNYLIEACENTGEFILKLNDRVIYQGVEGKVSIVNLFRSMNIPFSINMVDKIEKTEEDI